MGNEVRQSHEVGLAACTKVKQVNNRGGKKRDDGKNEEED